MGSALIGGLIAGNTQASDIFVYDKDKEKLKAFSDMGVNVAKSEKDAEKNGDIIVFSVKPNVIESVLKEMEGFTDKIYLSIAAGVTVNKIESLIGADKKIVRAMPNTPALVSCGMTVISPNKNVSDKEGEEIKGLLKAVGEVVVMPEKFMSIATALHGSSPAYVYMLIDAMADAGVEYGLSKKDALLLSAKAVEGSAKMVLETGVHPEQLKDNVCSPGGTTIAAVSDLEANGFRGVVQSAVSACVNKAESMSK